MWFEHNIPPPDVGKWHPPYHDDSNNGNATAQIAHELSNLLDGSLRNVSLALSKLDQVIDIADPRAEQTAERLRVANQAMTRMATLLQRWMHQDNGDVSRLYWQDANLGDAIHCAIRLIEPTAEQRDIQLVEVIPAEIAALAAGPLYPVLANTLRNALEAVSDGGRIEIHAQHHDHTATLHISDDGPGIDDHLPRDECGLVAPGTTTKPTGHGMGLAICRGIIESIGGDISLDSRHDGGTVVTIHWPIEHDCPTGTTS